MSDAKPKPQTVEPDMSGWMRLIAVAIADKIIADAKIQNANLPVNMPIDEAG